MFTVLACLLCALLMGFITRACGASWKPFTVEWVFAAPFAWAAYQSTGSAWVAIAALVFTYFAMQTGHGNAFHMGYGEHSYPDDPEKLDVIVRPITNLLGYAPRSAGYCWVFMGTKGLLIGLAAFPLGLFLAVLWPLGYWIGWRVWKGTLMGEWLTGGFAGIILYLSIA